jgi:hypothetical protein
MAAFLISLQLLPLVLFSPFLWAAVAFVAVVAGVAWRDCRAASAELPIISARRRMLELSTLLLMPALLLACGEYFSLPRALFPYLDEVLMALNGTMFVQTALAAWLVWRHRSRLLSTFLIAVLSVWWVAAAYALAGMAVTGNWL